MVYFDRFHDENLKDIEFKSQLVKSYNQYLYKAFGKIHVSINYHKSLFFVFLCKEKQILQKKCQHILYYIIPRIIYIIKTSSRT